MKECTITLVLFSASVTYYRRSLQMVYVLDQAGWVKARCEPWKSSANNPMDRATKQKPITVIASHTIHRSHTQEIICDDTTDSVAAKPHEAKAETVCDSIKDST